VTTTDIDEISQIEQAMTALEAQRLTLGDAVVDASLAALREKLAALKPEPRAEQRKLVTVLFCDLVGFTPMAEKMDPEDVREILNLYFKGWQEAIVRGGGVLEKFIGDAVMAVFGIPAASERDPEHAIRAALEVRDGLADLNDTLEGRHGIRLALRIGINTGLVLVAHLGREGDFTVTGDTVNLASRLEGAAPVGSVLISHDTYRHVRGVFRVQPLAPIQVKGKAEPIQVYIVERAKPRAFRMGTRGVEGIETRMIGRESELKRLQDTLCAAMEDGEGGMITIVGEAGVGKSRLLYEFEKWIDLLPETIRYFKGRARLETKNLPYALLRDLFAFRFQIWDSDRPDGVREKMEAGVNETLGEGETAQMTAHFLGQMLGFDFSDSPHLQGIVGRDAQQLRDRALLYVAEFFRATTALAPTVIFLEDVHWADDSSLDALNQLAWTASEQRLLIVCLTRPSLFERRPYWGAGQPFHTRLGLQPLSKQDSHRLVDEILQRAEQVPEALRELVVSGAEGNPFYIEELIKMLIEDGVIVKGEERWKVESSRLIQIRVPPTLTGVLQARLDSLPSKERTVLQQASVVGRTFWDGAVARISETRGQPGDQATRQRGDDPVRQRTGEREAEIQSPESKIEYALFALRAREMVFRRETSTLAGTGEYIFKHAVLHEVTYESVLKRLRRVYHGLVAEWLIEQGGERTDEYVGLIADHLESAGQTKQAATYLHRAGELAAARFANEAALNYYDRALALEERWEWLRGKVEVLHILGRRAEQRAALESLAAAPGAPGFDLGNLLGQYYEVVGEYAQAQIATERALAAARAGADVAGEAGCLARLGLIARRQGEYDNAREWYSQALELLGDEDTYPDEKARVLNGLGVVHRQQGSFDQARVCYQGCLALNRRSGNRRGEAETLNSLGVTAFYRRDFDTALTYYQQALEIRRAIGDRAGEGVCLFNLAVATCETGDYGQAQGYFSQALTIQQATGNRWEESNIWNSLGYMYQQLGDLATAKSCMQQGLNLAREIGDEAGQAYILSNLGLVAQDQGDLEMAERFLSDGLAMAQAHDDRHLAPFLFSYLASVSLLAGRLEQAVERANTALAQRQERQPLLTTADLATLAAAHLARSNQDQALNCARQALTILDECGGQGPEFPQRDYFLCYQVFSATGQEGEARAALGAAYNLVTTRAEKITDPSLRQSFLEKVRFNREIVEEYEKKEMSEE
jgi:class 3 adenylate cyclase/tetratricopeptide (TPR) repeat protein